MEDWKCCVNRLWGWFNIVNIYYVALGTAGSRSYIHTSLKFIYYASSYAHFAPFSCCSLTASCGNLELGSSWYSGRASCCLSHGIHISLFHSFISYSNHSLACSSYLEVSWLHHYQVKVVAALKNDGNFSFSRTSTVTLALGHFIFWHAFWRIS